MNKTVFRKLGILFSLCSLTCVIAGCNLYQYDIKEAFKEFTETAAVYSVDPYSYPVDKNGFMCIPSDSSHSFSFLMRNPQHYRLNFGYDFNGSALNSIYGTDAVSFNQPSDTTKFTMTYNQSFLRAVELSHTNNQNISGSITLTEPQSGRSFESYGMKFRVDTVPPVVETPCFMQTSDDASISKYVVLFNLPIFDDPECVHKDDTHEFYINGNLRYFVTSPALDATDVLFLDRECTIPDTNFTFDFDPSNFYPISDVNPIYFNDTPILEDNLTYIPVCYYTGISPTADEIKYTLTIKDDAGLSSDYTVSNKSVQLAEPVLDSNPDMITDEDTGKYIFTITHNGRDVDGNYIGDCYINYEVYEELDPYTTIFVTSGKSLSKVNIPLPNGKYQINAYASRNYYVSSEIAYDSPFIRRPAIFYVGNNGSSDGTGSKADPFKKLESAAESFNSLVASGECSDSDICIIRIVKNIERTPDYNLNNFALLNLSKVSSSHSKYIVEGYGGKFTIDAKGSTSQSARAICIQTDTSVTIRNLTLTGGYIGSAAPVSGGAICITNMNNNNTDVTLDNVTITGNKVTDTAAYGGAISAYNSGYANAILSLTLNNCVITDNTSTSTEGGGILFKWECIDDDAWTYNRIILKGKNTITGNYVDYAGVRKESNIQLGLDQVINVTPNISGSRIGISLLYSPSAGHPVSFTSGYLPSMPAPSSIFYDDNGTSSAARDPDSGEACLAIGGGSAQDLLFPDIKITNTITTENGYKVITFEPKLGNKANGASSSYRSFTDAQKARSSWSYIVKVGSDVLSSSYYALDPENPNVIKLPVTLDKADYDITATLTYSPYEGLTEDFTAHATVYVNPRSAANFTTSVPPGTKLEVDCNEAIAAISSMIGTGTNPTLNGVTFEQNENITLSGAWTPIGNTTNPFEGTYNGNGNSITGLNYSTSTENAGLFGVTRNADIKNITLTCTIYNERDYVGGIAGKVSGGTIENCTINSTSSVRGYQYNYSGGIAGYINNSAVIKNCRNLGSTAGRNYTGGIVGYIDSGCKVISCYSEGSVGNSLTGTSYRGGIAGYNAGTIQNCYSVSSISIAMATSGNAYSQRTAGIVGSNNGTVENCFAKNNFPYYGSTTSPYYLQSTVACVAGYRDINSNIHYTYFVTDQNTSFNCGLDAPNTNYSKSGVSPHLISDKAELVGNAAIIVGDPITVGITTSRDVVHLLNAYVDDKNDYTLYKRWKYNGTGIPVFDDD